MKYKTLFVSSLLIIAACLVFSFSEDNPYFKITPKNVELHIPKGFPKPYYTFSSNKLTPEIFVLGRFLFYDPILSRDSSTSCSSCHQRIAAFAHIDHQLSHGINGLIGKRNVPALQNLIFQNSFMWDGGVNHIEVQPLSPITNPIEMDESLAHIITKLKRTSRYDSLFTVAYKDTLINSERILKALTQFTGLMISNNSHYDNCRTGTETFTADELSGFKIFKTRCANCHAGSLFTDNSFRNNGIKPDTSLKDKGRETITGKPEDRNKFRVPSLRNIEMTYPYMHDGRFRNLAQVINHYANAKNYDAGYDVSLNKIGTLSDKDKSDLITFLKTLTDKTFLYDRRFADPFMK